MALKPELVFANVDLRSLGPIVLIVVPKHVLVFV